MSNNLPFKSSNRMGRNRLQPCPHGNGFSAVELLVVVCIIGILLITAVKQFQIYRYQARLTTGLASAQGVRLDVAEFYMFHGRWPTNSNELRDPTMSINDQNQSNFRITLENGGAINIWFQSMPELGKEEPVLTIRPAVSGGGGSGIISWLCGNAAAPGNAVVWGENQSNIPDKILIKVCR